MQFISLPKPIQIFNTFPAFAPRRGERFHAIRVLRLQEHQRGYVASPGLLQEALFATYSCEMPD
jgi:hypothetical protein